MITIDTATVDDILEFSKNIRKMDAEEVKFVSGKSFKEHLGFLVTHVEDVRVIKCNGVILGIGNWYQAQLDWGLYSPGVIGWMLLTNAVEDHKIEFLRWSKEIVKQLLEAYPDITNVVYAKNILHIKYLNFLGATMYPDPFRNDLLHFIIERS